MNKTFFARGPEDLKKVVNLLALWTSDSSEFCLALFYFFVFHSVFCNQGRVYRPCHKQNTARALR